MYKRQEQAGADRAGIGGAQDLLSGSGFGVGYVSCFHRGADRASAFMAEGTGRCMTMNILKEVQVELGSRSYAISIGTGLRCV